MAKICPGCGFQVDDDHALFCNKCGFPFPQQRPARSVVVKGPAASPAPRESRASRPSRAGSARMRGSGVNAFLSFDSLITGKYLKLIYIIGTVLIILVSLVGITGGFAVKGEVPANMSFANTSAVVQHSGSSPLFWFGFLVLGSLLWRMFCELFALQSVHTESRAVSEEEYPEEYAEEYDEAYAEPGPEEQVRYVTCPKCQKLVTTDQLRECEHCGIQGCVNCIRPMGLLKKTLTCRECFEAK